jgi:hypothetical protein
MLGPVTTLKVRSLSGPGCHMFDDRRPKHDHEADEGEPEGRADSVICVQAVNSTCHPWLDGC